MKLALVGKVSAFEWLVKLLEETLEYARGHELVAFGRNDENLGGCTVCSD